MHPSTAYLRELVDHGALLRDLQLEELDFLLLVGVAQVRQGDGPLELRVMGGVLLLLGLAGPRRGGGGGGGGLLFLTDAHVNHILIYFVHVVPHTATGRRTFPASDKIPVLQDVLFTKCIEQNKVSK